VEIQSGFAGFGCRPQNLKENAVTVLLVKLMSKEEQMLDELKKIREALEKPPAPAPPKGYGMSSKISCQNTRFWTCCSLHNRVVFGHFNSSTSKKIYCCLPSAC